MDCFHDLTLAKSYLDGCDDKELPGTHIVIGDGSRLLNGSKLVGNSEQNLHSEPVEYLR